MTSYEISRCYLDLRLAARPRTRVPRVLHILEATLGGTMRYLENLLSASADANIDTGFVYAMERADHQLAHMLRQAAQSGWQLFPIDMCREIAPQRDAASCWQLAKAIRQFRPDILHCHSSKAGALGRVASFACSPRPQVLYSPHALAGKRHHLLIEQTLKRITSAFVAVSDSERDQIVSYRLADRAKVEVLYPVVDVEHFYPADAADARHQLSFPDKPIVLGVGRLTEQKNPLHFLQVITRLRDHIPDVLGIWVGDGHLHRQFLSEANRLHLAGSIHLTGWQSDVRPFIAAADVMLSTSRFESFGYMVAEALAMQKPVVATRVCGTVDIMRDELAANLFDVDNTGEAVQLLTYSLQNTQFAHGIGLLGRRVVQQRFSKDQMEAKLKTYYQSLLPNIRVTGPEYDAFS